MVLKEVLEIYDLLDSPSASADRVADFIRGCAPSSVKLSTRTVGNAKGETGFIRIEVPGCKDNAPVLGVIGRLGGVGARPAAIGYVSDGDGALAVLAAALKCVRMASRGDLLPVKVIFITHIDPDAPVRPHEPVPFMGSVITSAECNEQEIEPAMDMVLSVDTTKGNRILNHRGIAITPTVKEGTILPVSNSLVDILSVVTGEFAYVLPLSQQDVTPYANELFHINSILQPAVATSAPVVGLAITTQSTVPGCASGASHPEDVESASRFILEVAKRGCERDLFYDKVEYERFIRIYGDGNRRFQK